MFRSSHRVAGEHAVPWEKFQYDVALGAYRTDLTESQLQQAPAFARQEGHDWSDLDCNSELMPTTAYRQRCARSDPPSS